jgi:hypothetical protein
VCSAHTGLIAFPAARERATTGSRVSITAPKFLVMLCFGEDCP